MFKTRIGIISGFLGCAVLLVLGRLWQLQVVRYERYCELAVRDHLGALLTAMRGTIYSQEGEVLAEDRAVYDLSVRVERLKLEQVTLQDLIAARGRFEQESQQDPAYAKTALQSDLDRFLPLLQQERFVLDLAQTIGRSPLEIADGVLKALDTVARKWAGARTPLRIATGIDEKIWLGLRAIHEDVFHDSTLLLGKSAETLASAATPPFPGLVCTISAQRVYPQGRLAAFLLGSVGELSAADEQALRADGILVDNAAARRQIWAGLRDSFDDAGARRLEALLRVDPRELERLAELYDRLHQLRPGELQLAASLGLAAPVGWLARPPKIQLSEPEALWLTDSQQHTLPQKWIGEMGVEAYYNDRLRGKHGMRIRGLSDDSDVRARQLLAQEGTPMALTISMRWQKAVENALKSQDRPGAAVVIDVHSGQVLALANWPDFDPNLFSPPRDNAQRQQELKAVLSDPAKPLLNRAISEQYPLGSCMKALIAAVALELKLVTPDETFECQGSILEGGQRFHCDDGRAHGCVNLYKALRCSCNVTFHQIGARIGVERLAPYARLFFGRRLGIDLTREVPGIYPDREWRLKAYPNNPAARIWSRGDDYQLAIGQGKFACTVLQAAVLMAALGNGGQVLTPTVWLDASAQAARQSLPVSAGNLAIVREGLDQVVNSNRPGERGTAYSAFHEQGPQLAVRIAGKTSSAEYKKGAKTHAWFAGYAPADKPRVAFAVLLEEAGHGGAVAAPVVYKFLREVYGTRNSPRAPWGEAEPLADSRP